jgi:Fe-Mn family superoxide dismutase
MGASRALYGQVKRRPRLRNSRAEPTRPRRIVRSQTGNPPMIVLPDLPYPYAALVPTLSDRTLKFHHDKHHKAYVETTNKLLDEAKSSPADLETVIREAKASGNKKLFNNAAQAWNHGFFWVSMTPNAEKPAQELAAAISGAFGDLGSLKQKFVEEGVAHFGSGWCWLIADRDGKLQVRTTHDADDTVAQGDGLTPLIVCDLWEHAYYLDYQNDRKGFLGAWFDALPNWSLAGRQLAAARGRGQAWRYPAPMAEAELKRASAG